jgi:uncharacterized protein (TIGR00290 family)
MLALYELLRTDRYEVVALLTTVAEEYDRVSHHGVRAELLEQQAAALALRLHKLYLPAPVCTNEEYEALMERTMRGYQAEGVRTVAFGDIFLQALRARREQKLAEVGMQGLFPLWQRDTARLVRDFVALGFRAYLTCVDGRKLGREFAGRPIDGTLLAALPPDVDPCGENGEFHSFVYDGPLFRRPVAVRVGEIVERDVRYFADLLPGT